MSKSCLFLTCCRQKATAILSELEKKQYIIHFLEELANETENEIDDILIDFVKLKLKLP